MMLRLLQQTGHKPVVLMGGGTTRIGDPTGRDESLKMLSDATIAANIASIFSIFQQFLSFGDGPTDAVMVDNQDRSEEHTSELPSLLRITYAVFCLKIKKLIPHILSTRYDTTTT